MHDAICASTAMNCSAQNLMGEQRRVSTRTRYVIHYSSPRNLISNAGRWMNSASTCCWEGQALAIHVMWMFDKTRGAHRGVTASCRPRFCQHKMLRPNRTPSPHVDRLPLISRYLYEAVCITPCLSHWKGGGGTVSDTNIVGRP